MASHLVASQLAAQPRPPVPICVPGTPLCASADGKGGIQVTGRGNGQVTPNGANASGQGSAQGGGSANANAHGNAQGGGQGGTQGGGAGQGGTQGGGAGQGGAQGGGAGQGGGQGNSLPSRGQATRYHYNGRFGVGAGGCAIVRIGVWSGFKEGGCFAVSFRFEALTFEMETQLLYGGTTHAFD